MCNTRPIARSSRILACAAICAVLAVPDVHAQTGEEAADRPRFAATSSSVTLRTADRPVNLRDWGSIAAAGHSGRLSLVENRAHPAARAKAKRHGRSYRQAQRLTAAFALGIFGSLAGGLAGGGLAGLTSEDAVLPGFAVGRCVGGLAGATAGALLVK